MAGEHVNKVVMNGNTLVDLTSDTVSPSTLVLGETAHDRSGASITGQFYPTFVTSNHAQYTPPVSPCLVLDTTDGVLYMESSGTYTAVTANPKLMSASTRGGAKLGSGLAVDANDVLSVDTASVKSSIVTGQALAPASVTATGAISGSSISDGTGTLAQLRESVSTVESSVVYNLNFTATNAGAKSVSLVKWAAGYHLSVYDANGTMLAYLGPFTNA